MIKQLFISILALFIAACGGSDIDYFPPDDTADPSPSPTVQPSAAPTVTPTQAPTSVPTLIPSSNPTPSPEGALTLEIELEQLAAQNKFSPFSVLTGEGASGGQYIAWPNDGTNRMNREATDNTDGQFEISFHLSENTPVSFSIVANLATEDDDSFHYRFSGGQWRLQNDVRTDGWQTIPIANMSFAAGRHTLGIQRREDGALLDKIILTVESGYISTDTQPAPLPSFAPTPNPTVAPSVPPSSTPTPTPSSTPLPGPNLDDIQRGQALFEDKCVSCHAATLKGVGEKADGSGHDLPSLTQAIALNMPLGRPLDCVDDCADLTAKYIASVNQYVGSSTGGEVDQPIGNIDAAPVTLTRLNRAEYNNTVRDLLGTAKTPADSFPVDDFGRFNNDGDVLTVSLLHVEGYFKASAELASEVVEAAKTGDRSVISCDPLNETCVNTVIKDFGLRAWRRPVSTEEASRLLETYNTALRASDSYLAMATMIRQMLLSPYFNFRPEIDDDLNSSTAKPLSNYELASRLSYFLWSSMPDDQLFAKAADGSLNNDAVLRAEVDRMLDDPKAQALLDNFTAQWLGYEEVDHNDPSRELFPNFDNSLKEDFKRETRYFLEYMLDNNRPVTDIVNGNYTFLNGPLANHYGVSGISGESMAFHTWGENAIRRGILGHASVLMAHSHATKTSPVKRGIWVMDRIMCDRPSEPTPELLAQFPELPEGLNPREESELHKDSSTVCYTCHAYVDPIGYGLENFSPIGQWREAYPDGGPVNAQSQLPSGDAFSNLVGLSEALSKDPDVAMCAIQHSMSFALGRVVNTLEQIVGPNGEPTDYPAIYDVYKKTEANGHRFRDVLTEVVLSPAFRNRRGANSQ